MPTYAVNLTLTNDRNASSIRLPYLTLTPYEEVTPKHNTLQVAETMALTASFVTLAAGIALTESTDVVFGALYTTAIITVNVLFMLKGVWWYFVLLRMDLENIVEKAKKLHWFSFTALKFLALVVPDWEKSGRKQELAREEDEAIEDLKHMDLKWARRMKEISHRWVESYRRHKLNQDGGVRIVPIGHGSIENTNGTHAVLRAQSIERQNAKSSEAFHKSQREKQEKSKLRLTQRRRTRASGKSRKRLSWESSKDDDGNVVTVVLEEHVEFAALGLKLKFDGTKCVVYKVNSGSIAERHGLAKGDILDSAGDQPIRDEAWVTKKLFHETRPLRLVFLRNHIIQDKIR